MIQDMALRKFRKVRALRDFDDTDAEATEAASMAVETIGELHDTLASLDRWVEW